MLDKIPAWWLYVQHFSDDAAFDALIELFTRPMIPKSFVQELLGRVDVVDVIESYLPLKRAGSNLVACCPFHSEKTPSFTVSQTKQFYHCFGCGAHGTAIGFLIEYSGMGYVEAVKDLAARVGMKVPDLVPSPRQAAREVQSEELGDLLQRAAQYFKAELKRSQPAIMYLKGRGLTGEIAARFHLGYAPAGWQNLANVFDHYQAQSLVDAGLVVQGDEGKRYDRFRDRIMFPILSQRGQIVGFGGRVLDKSEPKYLNSPETPLFEKGRELYGLFQARQGIRAAGRIVVVEGYMDVVALAQHGVDYACATLGTATTQWHVQKLLRQAEEVVFCFDGDAAGQRAAWRALETCMSQLQDGKQVKFLFLPAQDDPDSYVRREGKEAFERLLASAVPLSEFTLRHLAADVDMGSAEGRAKFLQDAKPLVKEVNAPIFGLMLRKRVAELAGVSQAELEDRLELSASQRRGARAPVRSNRPSSDPYARLLERVVADPKLLADLVTVGLPGPSAASAEAQALLDLIEEARSLTAEITTAGAIELLRERGHEAVSRQLIPRLQDFRDFSYDELRQDVLQQLDNLKKLADDARRRQLASRVTSPADLTEEDRFILARRAPVEQKAVKAD